MSCKKLHGRFLLLENIFGLHLWPAGHGIWLHSQSKWGTTGATSSRVTSETGLKSGVQAHPERVFWMRKWFEVQSKLTLRLYEIQMLFYSSSLLSLLYTHSIFLSFSLSLFSLSNSRSHAFMDAGAMSSGTTQSKSKDKNCVLQGSNDTNYNLSSKCLISFFLSF